MRPSKVGVVVSQGKMDKTVKVRFRNVNWNKTISKYIVSHRNMLIHDELNKCREGDVVRCQYVRPLSARKSWAVAEFVKLKGTSWEKYSQEIPREVERDELEKLQNFNAERQRRAQLGGDDVDVWKLRHGQIADPISLDLSKMRDEVNDLWSNAFWSSEARRLLREEPEKANDIVKGTGRNPNGMKSGMKRNIILKYLQNSPVASI